MKTLKLINGVEMPMPDLSVCEKAVTNALEVGYRFLRDMIGNIYIRGHEIDCKVF